jgi:hypothetical protein
MDFIDGIYNYCDRWCERCGMTAHCRVYASENKSGDSDVRDPDNRKFWEEISEIFAKTLRMLESEAERLGITWDEEKLKKIGEEQARRHERIKKHPLLKVAQSYAELAREWLDEAQDLLQKKAEEWQQQYEMNIDRPGLRRDAEQLEDVMQIIRWYQPQIQVKLNRALHSRESELKTEDARGSAKVALIGMDRSTGAWGWLYQQFPEQEDDLLPILVSLERLSRDTEKTFPRARSFQRPGFDSQG